MNRHWVKLEFPAVLERLARYTDFSGGKALAFELAPVFEIHEARDRLALTREARALLQSHRDFALGGISDIRPYAEQAEHGVTLLAPALLEVRNTLLSAARIHLLLSRLETQFPALADLAWRIRALPGLVETIARVLDDRGEVRDNASSELARIRHDLRLSQDRIQDRLMRIINSSEVAPYLQETLITRREGRFVIPVQADFKGHVQGVVHDRSASGATLFMEPLQVVELNNTLRELKLAEEDEILRLLRSLTVQVAQGSDEIRHTLDALAELDLVLAKARYAEELAATEPELRPVAEVPAPPEGDNRHPGTCVYLKAARHPLLHPEKVVPVDAVLEDGTHILIITGPNTGGKTVSLKTVGLLTLMALSGMHLPVAPGSAVSCFSSVVADIGDEQSIEQNLSTFSSHLGNILSFLPDVDHTSLVLLDELGAGTDPAEGSALARALLEAFRLRRCTVLVATHYPELKLYAHHTPGVENASMEFNVETLAPTYHLTIGLPGRSNAFAIARRLGMPDSIVRQAQGMLTGEELRAEDMLHDLHNLRIQQVAARDEARKARLEADGVAQDLRRRLIEIETERHDLLKRAENDAQAEVEALREELRAMRKRVLSAPLREAQATLAEVETDLQRLEVSIPQPEPLLEDLVLDQLPPPAPRPVQAGDTVEVVSFGIKGTVLAIEDNEVLVQAGSLRTRVLLGDVQLIHHNEPVQTAAAQVSLPSRGSSPGMQIDIRGHTVEDALESLDRYLDNAAMAGLPWVRIVHGKGTGRLRREVRRFIESHPLVSSHETAALTEGGDGATVVHLVQAG